MTLKAALTFFFAVILFISESLIDFFKLLVGKGEDGIPLPPLLLEEISADF